MHQEFMYLFHAVYYLEYTKLHGKFISCYIRWIKRSNVFYFILKDMVEEISTCGGSSADLNDSYEANSNISEDIHDEEVCTMN